MPMDYVSFDTLLIPVAQYFLKNKYFWNQSYNAADVILKTEFRFKKNNKDKFV